MRTERDIADKHIPMLLAVLPRLVVLVVAGAGWTLPVRSRGKVDLGSHTVSEVTLDVDVSN